MLLGGAALAIALAGSLYFNKVQRSEIKHLDEVVKEKSLTIKELEADNASLVEQLDRKTVEFNRVSGEYEDYKDEVAGIDLTPKEVPVFVERIKEVPIETVITEANEASNGIIKSINDRAVDFTSSELSNTNGN